MADVILPSSGLYIKFPSVGPLQGQLQKKFQISAAGLVDLGAAGVSSPQPLVLRLILELGCPTGWRCTTWLGVGVSDVRADLRPGGVLNGETGRLDVVFWKRSSSFTEEPSTVDDSSPSFHTSASRLSFNQFLPSLLYEPICSTSIFRLSTLKSCRRLRFIPICLLVQDRPVIAPCKILPRRGLFLPTRHPVLPKQSHRTLFLSLSRRSGKQL